MAFLTIDIDVDKEILEKAGSDSLREYLTEQAKAWKFRVLSEEIRQAVKESGIDFENDMNAVKQKTWEKYKRENLGDLLK